MPKTFGGLIEDIFQNGFQNLIAEDAWNETAPVPVNIQETETTYDIHVVAPGFNKNEFKVSVDKNVLHISYEHREENTEEKGKYLRKEYKIQSFKRSFTLNEKVDISHIVAKYESGILYITLPKKESKEPTTQEIKIN
jgi:HSP20 family protein